MPPLYTRLFKLRLVSASGYKVSLRTYVLQEKAGFSEEAMKLRSKERSNRRTLLFLATLSWGRSEMMMDGAKEFKVM